MGVTESQVGVYEGYVSRSRSRPILWYLKACANGQEACAYDITQHAIKEGYIETRIPIPGNTLKDWLKKNKAPLWAARSAMELAVKTGWTPGEEYEWVVVAHLVSRGGGEVPAAINCDEMRHWLSVAKESSRLFVARKELKGHDAKEKKGMIQ